MSSRVTVEERPGPFVPIIPGEGCATSQVRLPLTVRGHAYSASLTFSPACFRFPDALPPLSLALSTIPMRISLLRRRTSILPSYPAPQTDNADTFRSTPISVPIVDHVLATTTTGASMVAVHWRGPPDYPLNGDEAHAVLGACLAFESTVQHREAEFVLDVWKRT